ncbi:carbohydrate porin [Robiginitalea sp. M39]|uniref:Carbohydrate porin n=1 Tax=Robiginitalea aurantiaca TaxID=3056915 RepID=A0ABT7WCC1_9FLAO|nr:carbohydrate porin [Robiginitalea aurantiaca]
MSHYLYKLLLPALMIGSSVTLNAQEQPKKSDSLPKLGSADQVDNRLELDQKVTKPLLELPFLTPYFDFKEGVKTSSGLGFATEYSSLFVGTNADMGQGKASSGIWKFYGSWDLVGRKSGNSGALIFKVEHRHKYGNIPPKSLGLDMGYVGFIAPPFSNDGWRATNLYWRQRFMKGRLAVVAGFLDVTDFFDVYALASPWMHFTNFAFSTGAAAVNVPNDGYLGLSVGGWISDKVYGIAGFGDINSDPSDIFNGFDAFFTKKEYFKHVEIGITSSKDYMLLDNIHVSFWQRDATSATGDPNGWGLVLSATKYLQETYLPFFRYAYTKDAGSLLQHSIVAGIGYQPLPGSHLAGFAFNWGQVNETTFGTGLDDQFAFELFYRLQLSSKVAVTPDLQYMINPALNPEQASIFLYSLRARIVL